MKNAQDLLTIFVNHPLLLGLLLLAAILLMIGIILRHRPNPQQRQQAILQNRCQAALDKLRLSDALQMLELSEQDALTIIEIVIQDEVKLGGKLKRAAQHIQKAAYERAHATYSEDQITAVLVAYEQSSDE